MSNESKKTAVAKRPRIGVVGCYQNGKSTLVNCLLDARVASMGHGAATTRLATRFTWGEAFEAHYVMEESNRKVKVLKRHPVSLQDYALGKGMADGKCAYQEVKLWKPFLQYIDLVDTPGFNDCDEDNATATNSLADLDFAVFVVRNKALSEIEITLLKTLSDRQLPFAVLVNCTESSRGYWQPESDINLQICHEIEGRLKSFGHMPFPIQGRYVWPVNLAWFWYASQHMSPHHSEAEKDLYEDVEYFANKHLKLSQQDYSALAGMSNFIPLRQAFLNLSKHWVHDGSESGNSADSSLEASQQLWDDGLEDEAMLYVERACNQAPGYIPALLNKAELCFRREEYLLAIETADEILSISPDHILAFYYRALAHHGLKDYSNCVATIDQLLDVCEQRSSWQESSDLESVADNVIDAYWYKMDCLMRRREYREVVTVCESLLSNKIFGGDEPGLAIQLTVYCVLGEMYRLIGSYLLSIKAIHNAMRVYVLKSSDDNKRAGERMRWLSLDKAKYHLGSGDLGRKLQSMLFDIVAITYKGDPGKIVRCCHEYNALPVLYKQSWEKTPQYRLIWARLEIEKNSEVDEDVIEQYLKQTQDNKIETIKTAIGFYNASMACQSKLNQLFIPKVLIGWSLDFSNNLRITNKSLFSLTDIRINVTYKNKSFNRTRIAKCENLDPEQTHEWSDFFSDKGGFLMFHGISDVKVVSQVCHQGSMVGED